MKKLLSLPYLLFFCFLFHNCISEDVPIKYNSVFAGIKNDNRSFLYKDYDPDHKFPYNEDIDFECTIVLDVNFDHVYDLKFYWSLDFFRGYSLDFDI